MKALAKWVLAETLWFKGAVEERKAPNEFTLTFFVVAGQQKTKVKKKLAGFCIAFQSGAQVCLDRHSHTRS